MQFTCNPCQFQIHKVMIHATNSQTTNHHLLSFIYVFILIFNWTPLALTQPLKNTPPLNETFSSKFNRSKTSYLKKDFHKFLKKNMISCLWLASYNQTLTMVQNKIINKENWFFWIAFWFKKIQSRMHQCNFVHELTSWEPLHVLFLCWIWFSNELECGY